MGEVSIDSIEIGELPVTPVHYAVLLKNSPTERGILLYIEPVTASAINDAASPDKNNRPSSYSLIFSIIESLEQKLVSVSIDRTEGDAYCATLRFESGIEIDSRSSDALALALHTLCVEHKDIAIYFSETLFGERSLPANHEATVASVFNLELRRLALEKAIERAIEREDYKQANRFKKRLQSLTKRTEK